MLKKRFITVILTLAVAVAIPCTAFAGELDADTTADVSPTSIEKNVGDSVYAVNSSAVTNEAVTNENEADNNDKQDVANDVAADTNTDADNKQPATETDTETDTAIDDEQIVDTTESADEKKELVSEEVATQIGNEQQAAEEQQVPAEVVIAEQVPAEEVMIKEILDEPVPLEEVAKIIAEIPVESTLIIHHLFQYGDIVCDDYETITGLTAGGSICIGEYNYEEDYIFADCLNADEMFTLAEGENQVVLNYTLKDGFRIAE